MGKRKKVHCLEHGTVIAVNGEMFTVEVDGTKEHIQCSIKWRCHIEAVGSVPRLSFIRRLAGSVVAMDARMVFRRHVPDPFLRLDQETVYADWAFTSEYEAFMKVIEIGKSEGQQSFPFIS